ncbi:MAG: excinuclease ABC subunit C [Nitrospirae bacterium GWF2_44_13]|nr:MAG: excinuclease ABC subunit C [Nitrospirae bacterium GWF2_44_13]OGW66324.1 MAG: excinuclease ABC subunit C [Nitrospirae bacterium RIFOXYA2_FULL_44_9]OGW72957.1 MAG: excinuclease ABC subunit C [Nitrospirae bacterium RIFOXYC2_FULL_44_7]
MIEKLLLIPPRPGVYLLKDAKENVLYAGKAKNLRNRLRSYFRKSADLDARKSSMIRSVKNFSYIVTGNELEALVLEANMIKQYKPRFNVILRDDKNYPYLKLTVNEVWPRLEVVRRIKKDGALYFGPYVPARGMWEAVAFIRRNFPLRPCKYSLDKHIRPCIQHQMGKCPAPCDGLISKEEYMRIVEDVRLFLHGEKKELLDELEKRMERFSEELRFEDAAKIRDSINNLRHIWESQKAIAPELGDIDVIGFYGASNEAVLKIFFIRNGVMIGTKDFHLKDTARLATGELLHNFVEQFYAKEIIPPDEIVMGQRPDGMKTLTAWLRDKKGKKVAIITRPKGKKLELLKMAEENAGIIFKSREKTDIKEILKTLKERLVLKNVPRSIGGLDVSTISGSESVGAFVYWAEGGFKKDMYRHMKIRTVKGMDDYSMIEEITGRVIRNLGEKLPTLIIIDGGRGQLEAAKKAFDESGVKSAEIISIAKKPDRAFALSLDKPVDLEDNLQSSPSSLLLKKIRNEAHRFAITFHRKLRDKRLMESPLKKIQGIGEKRRLALLRHFGSIEGIRQAGIDDIAVIKGFNIKTAEKLLAELGRGQ